MQAGRGQGAFYLEGAPEVFDCAAAVGSLALSRGSPHPCLLQPLHSVFLGLRGLPRHLVGLRQSPLPGLLPLRPDAPLLLPGGLRPGDLAGGRPRLQLPPQGFQLFRTGCRRCLGHPLCLLRPGHPRLQGLHYRERRFRRLPRDSPRRRRQGRGVMRGKATGGLGEHLGPHALPVVPGFCNLLRRARELLLEV